MFDIEILKYHDDHKDEWNSFVRLSNNGTFLFDRHYVEYHRGRFIDASLLLYHKSKLIAIFPASIKDNIVTSHAGLTYGGLITEKINGTIIGEAIKGIVNFYNNCTFVWKPVPSIYHSYPTETEDFWLLQNKFKLTSVNVSSYKLLNTQLGMSKEKKYDIRRATKKYNLIFGNNINKLEEFWYILADNLEKNHNTKPVHSIDEITKLHNDFPNNIKLSYLIYENDLIAGMITYINKHVHHVQYSAFTDRAKKMDAGNVLILNYCKNVGPINEILEFGISNERNGELNTGLYEWKSKFGCADILYKTYYK
jgi:hypothetical protein